MSEKKKHKHETEEINQTNAEAVATPLEAVEMPEFNEQAAAEIDALKENVEGWQRSLADFQNYKKRIEREDEIKKFNMKGDIIKKVLPVLDDLERALQNRPADDSWASGIELIARKFQNMLDSENLKRIEAVGMEFNPTFHEAISHEPAENVASGHVIAVVQNGYMLGERVIRPALVRVAQ